MLLFIRNILYIYLICIEWYELVEHNEIIEK